MVLSTDEEKAFGKTQQPFIIKNSQQAKNRRALKKALH